MPLTCVDRLQSVGAVGGGPDGMDVDGGATRKLYVGTHALSQRRDHMEVRCSCLSGCPGCAGCHAWSWACVPPMVHAFRCRHARHAGWAAKPGEASPGLASAAAAACTAVQVVSPFQDGILSDWEVAEGLLQHALK